MFQNIRQKLLDIDNVEIYHRANFQSIVCYIMGYTEKELTNF